jgi:hypothetical protein
VLIHVLADTMHQFMYFYAQGVGANRNVYVVFASATLPLLVATWIKIINKTMYLS